MKALTEPSVEYVTQETDQGRVSTKITTPPLITQLLNGPSGARGPKSASTPLPVDAEALEIAAQIREQVVMWSRRLHVRPKVNLVAATIDWYSAHAAAVRNGRFTSDDDLAATIAAESWVRMIRNKYDGPELREWTGHCVNDVTAWEGDALIRERCGARRIVIDGAEQFAIQLNVTEETATCRACGHVWKGQEELMHLRLLTNIDQAARTGGTVDPAALRILNS